MGFIEPEEYREILERTPIPCVDAVVVMDGKFVLIRRKDEPAKGQWWLPGGRVYKNELMEDAIKRKVKEELGIAVTIVKQLGADETIFDTGPFGFGVHSVNVFFLAEPLEKHITVDSHHSAYRLFDSVDEQWHPYVKRVVRAALAEMGK